MEEPVRATVDPLGAAYAVADHGDDETPMFKMLRSSWFSGDGAEQGWGTDEIDAGWQAVERVAETAPSRLTRSGLPVRDPGNRLVPGGVTKSAPTFQRDPEAIRARLAAHAAGVARGRTRPPPRSSTTSSTTTTTTSPPRPPRT